MYSCVCMYVYVHFSIYFHFYFSALRTDLNKRFISTLLYIHYTSLSNRIYSTREHIDLQFDLKYKIGVTYFSKLLHNYK